MPSAVRRILISLAAPAVLCVAPLAPGPTPAAAQAPDAPGEPLRLLEQTPWVEPGEDFLVTVELSDGVPEDARLELELRTSLTSRHAFTESLEGTGAGGRIALPFSGPVADIEPDADGTFTVGFGTGPDGAGLAGQDGVYPVHLRLTDATGAPLSEIVTYLLLLPPPTPAFTPLAFTVVAELGAAPGQQPDGSVRLDPETRGRVRDRADLIQRSDVPITLAPVPETLDALALWEADRGVPTDDSLIGLLAAGLPGHEVLARPYVDIDMESWVDARLLTEAAPEAAAGADVVRSRLGVEPAPHIWLPGPAVGEAEAVAWRDLGVTHAILPPTAVDDIPDHAESINPPIRLPGGIPAFVSDDDLVDRLLAVDEPLDSYRFLAELAMIWREYPSRDRAVVLRIPEDAAFDPETVATTLNHLRHGQAVDAMTASQLFALQGSADDLTPVEAGLRPRDTGDDLGWMVPRIEAAKGELHALADVLDVDGELERYQRALLIAPGARTGVSTRRAYLNEITDATAAVAEAVSAPEYFRITLTARDSTIPLTIDNDLDHEVAVRVHLDSNQLEFPDGSSFDLVVPPGSERIDLAVRTRTSGGFPLRITLTSPDGRVVLDETTFDIRSTTISGVGWVLSVGAALFLVTWWGRHWYRSRKQPSPDATEARSVTDPTTQDQGKIH